MEDIKKFARTDCRYFIGEKPCRFKRECPGCEKYDAIRETILVIKLAAAGDVLRTTPLLRALREKHPGAYITWLVDRFSLELLEGIPLIDRLLPYGVESIAFLETLQFDRLYALDKEPGATAAAMKIRAGKKFGFCHTEAGKLSIFNPEAAYAFRLGISDHLKFKENRKSYQEIIFELAGMPFRGEDYLLSIPEVCRKKINAKLKPAGSGKRIALNLGAGPVFANKSWPEDYFVDLIQKLRQEEHMIPVVVAGPGEKALYDRVLKKAGQNAFAGGCDNSLMEFAALLESCDVVVAGDTMALHIALACRRRVVGLFGPTCRQEILLYGRGELLTTPKACAPCYLNACDIRPNCMEEIPVKQVFQAIHRQLAE